MAKSDMNFHVGNTDYLRADNLDLHSKTVHSVGKSKVKMNLNRKPTLWDMVAKDKHDQDYAVEKRNEAARHRMNHNTAQYLLNQIDE